MSKYFAQPYDQSATGFFFEDMETYQQQYDANVNTHGQPVEEYELMYIDGDYADLFKACGINQSNLETWFDGVVNMDENDQVALFYLMDNNLVSDLQDAIDQVDDVSIYHGRLEDAAIDLFDDVYAYEIPANLRHYIDYKAFANDLRCGGDMSEFEYNGSTYTCTNANCM